MKVKYTSVIRSVLFILIINFVSCSTVPINLDTAKQNVIAYFESGKFDEELNKIIEDAIRKFSRVEFTGTEAVVFDIDETALSNYDAMKEFDFGYIPHLWDEWEAEARAPAIKQVKELYDYLVGRGAKIIFLTGRKNYNYEPTYINLKNEGYHYFDTLITRQPHEYGIPAIEYKSNKRVELTRMGYNIVGTVGDQWSDLRGPYSGIQIKIPNYFYSIE